MKKLLVILGLLCVVGICFAKPPTTLELTNHTSCICEHTAEQGGWTCHSDPNHASTFESMIDKLNSFPVYSTIAFNQTAQAYVNTLRGEKYLMLQGGGQLAALFLKPMMLEHGYVILSPYGGVNYYALASFSNCPKFPPAGTISQGSI